MTLSTREKILIGALVATILVAAAVVMVATYTIRNTGTIVTVGLAAFWDPAGAQLCTSIEWGTMQPGGMKGVTLYLKNTQALNITLAMNTSSWQPPDVQQYFTLAWNYSGALLMPAQMIPVQFTLSLSPLVQNSTNFSFNINLIATQT
jgi:membrane protease YdiL (CAAX protease family)